MLPNKGKSKKIYQLHNKCEYRVFDSKVKLYDKGGAKGTDFELFTI